MKNILIAILFSLFCTLVGCKSDTVAPDWRIEGPRVLAITADKPVFSPGDTVDLSLLLAGVDMIGRTTATVEWSLGNVLQSVPADRAARFEMPATNDVDIYFGADADYQYTTTGHVTVIAHAVVRLADGTLLPAQKSFLLAKSSVVASLNYRNPDIARILVEIPGHSGLSIEAGAPVFIPAAATAKTIKLQAELTDNANIEAYGYRWFVESSLADVMPVVETGAASSKVEVALPQLGALTVHLIVEDRSEEMANALYQGGVDFVSFTVAIGSDTSDNDTLSPDEGTTDDTVDIDQMVTDTDTLLTD